MSETSIEWTDTTWNPISGCTRVSPGCEHCYAERIAHRFRDMPEGHALRGLTTESGRWNGTLRKNGRKFSEPFTWTKPRRVFVNSMSDLFHEKVQEFWLDEIWCTMAGTPQHTYQILTKRPERMREYLSRANERMRHEAWPLPNVWLGVSVENQKAADERIPLLLQTPASVRFLSVEPLLGPVDLERVPLPDGYLQTNGITGVLQPTAEKDSEPDDFVYWRRKGFKLDWVIVGGESGPGARRFDIAWARSIRNQCKAAGVAFFFKQAGAFVVDRNDAGFMGEFETAWPDSDIDPASRIEHDLDGTRDGYQGAPVRIHLRDRKGGDMAEWPEDLRVREWPR